jgi:DnaJ-domain-containing protein 1
MFPKMLILPLLVVVAFDGISALPKTVKSGQGAAEEAYNNFVILTNENAKTTEDFLDAQFMTKVAAVESMEEATVKALDDKIKQVEESVLQINATTQLIDNSRCVWSSYIKKLEDFRSKLAQRAKNCSLLTEAALDSLKNVFLSDVRLQQKDLLGCYSRSLEECKSFAKDDSCYDFFITQVEAVQANVETDFGLIRAHVEAKVVAFKLPCWDLIELGSSVFPDYILQTISQCLETDIRNNRPNTCPYSYPEN